MRAVVSGIVCVAAFYGGTTPAFAADAADSSAQADYQRNRARCELGQTTEDRATCLREAGAAYQQRSQLDTGASGSDLQRNALTRCAALPASDQADCRARVAGQGLQEGSVKGGGIFKETVTETIGAPPAAPGGSTSAPAGTPSAPPR